MKDDILRDIRAKIESENTPGEWTSYIYEAAGRALEMPDYDNILFEYSGFRTSVHLARAACDVRKLLTPISPEEQIKLIARHLDAALLRDAPAAIYRLIDLRDGSTWDFQYANDLTDMMFVLTMWSPHAAVYKHGKRYDKALAGETTELAAALEAWNA